MFYVLIMGRLESNWIHVPAALMVFYVASVAALARVRWLEGRELRVDDVLVYEDAPDPEVQTLELG